MGTLPELLSGRTEGALDPNPRSQPGPDSTGSLRRDT